MNKQSPSPAPKRSLRSWLLVLLIIGLLAGGIFFAFGNIFRSNTSALSNVPVFSVTQNPLTISVSESGTIRSSQQIAIKSEVEGQTTILYLVPEGTQVKKDELLIELDASKLEDNLVDQQIRSQNAEAAFIRARENLAVVKNQAKADNAQAALNHRFAEEDSKMYLEGEYPKKLKEMESKIALAEEELQRAKQKFDGSEVLFQEKYISQTELQADGLAAKKAELNVDLAREELNLLQKYTHQRRLDELAAALEQAEMALERVTRKAAADVVQAEAEFKAKEAEYSQHQARLQKIHQQMEKTKIRAPRAGLVVYASSTRATWRGNQDPLAEGQVVRERQELIFLPTADAMMAEVKIPEARLQIIEVGLPARITVDGLPGRTFTGRVTKIAPLPDATSMFMNPDLKVYNTEVHLADSDVALRPGMSCTVEIVAAHYPDAIYVPVHAVVRQGTQPVVYIWEKDQFVAQPVEIGLDNNRMVHVTSGLAPGAAVMLNPPLSGAAVSEQDAALTKLVESMADPPATMTAPMPVEAAAKLPPAVEEESTEDGDRGRRRSQMTPEQREELRQRVENMSPEEREQFRQSRQRRSGDS